MGKDNELRKLRVIGTDIKDLDANSTVLYILACVITGIMMLIATPQSPINNQLDWDAGIFFQCGREIASGKVMFKDVADAKGLYIFLLNAVAAMISRTDSTGLFIIQCIFMTVMTVFIYKTVMIMTGNDNKTSLVSTIIMQSININPYHTASFNFTEWYVLLFQYISMYLLVKHFYDNEGLWGHSIESGKSVRNGGKGKNRHWNLTNYNPVHMLIHGINVGIALNFKLTYILYFIPLLLLINIKDKKNTLQNIVYGLAGVLIGCIPTILYCTITNSWSDMLYHSITFNMMYTRTDLGLGSYVLRVISGLLYSKYAITTILIILASLYTYAKFKGNGSEKKLGTIMTLTSIFIFAGIATSGKYSPNYYISVFPIFLFGVVGISRVLRERYIVVLWFIMLGTISMSFGSALMRTYEHGAEIEYKDDLLAEFDKQYGYIDRHSIVNIGYGCKLEVRYGLESSGIVSVPLIDYSIWSSSIDERVNRVIQDKPEAVFINNLLLMTLKYEASDELKDTLNNYYELKLHSSNGDIKTGIPCQGVYIRKDKLK